MQTGVIHLLQEARSGNDERDTIREVFIELHCRVLVRNIEERGKGEKMNRAPIRMMEWESSEMRGEVQCVVEVRMDICFVTLCSNLSWVLGRLLKMR